jgi:hypothetical protein
MNEISRVWTQLKIKHKDRTIPGSYSTEKGLVYVRAEGREKIAQIGLSRPRALAQMMTRQIAQDIQAGLDL